LYEIVLFVRTSERLHRENMELVAQVETLSARLRQSTEMQELAAVLQQTDK